MIRKTLVVSALTVLAINPVHAENVAMPKMTKQQVYSMLKSEIENDTSIAPLAKCISKSPNEVKAVLVSVLDKCWDLAPEKFDQFTDENDMKEFALCYESTVQQSFGTDMKDVETCVEQTEG